MELEKVITGISCTAIDNNGTSHGASSKQLRQQSTLCSLLATDIILIQIPVLDSKKKFCLKKHNPIDIA
jgi:hypothetical protein